MRLEPLTPKKRAQFDEKTRGQEMIALAALAISGALFVFLSSMTERAVSVAIAVPCVAFALIAYRNGLVYGEMGLKVHRHRSMLGSGLLMALALVLLAAGEIIIRLRG